MSTSKATRFLQRYNDSDRINHWVVAILFVLAGLSGLAFFHPAFYFFTALFGGGVWARILHPFMGVAMFVFFLGLFFKLWKQNVMNATDREWIGHGAEMMRGDKSNMPPVGKYNAGQKLVFWVMAISLLVLLVTGVMFWQPWFADSFSVPLRRVAVVLHAASAVALILGTTMHVYAAIWVKGTVRAMTRGTVSEAWARQNHPLWYEEMTGRK